jgi:hypothetical protein
MKPNPVGPDEKVTVGYVLVNREGIFCRVDTYQLQPETQLRRATVFDTVAGALGAVWTAGQRNGEGRVSQDADERRKSESIAGLGNALRVVRVVRTTQHLLEEL